ncbi:hypothetical protein [Pseudomarimonas arenosa]|uniref:Late embryogenesis abundant protein n=1 Tax=Pseudomarimonas arenosa TaxID=2774145 RepID=A0AAW3ZQG4_9GAMM|nr:hypothetical protein [Pseudomarimonas arenosa]MBD8527382.1 hypothetical protein [Pseudomarimonas arenosa]
MHLRLFAALLMILSLAACAGGPPKRVFPPEVSLQELRVEGDQWLAVIRLNSFSDLPMTLNRLEGQISLADGPAMPILLSSEVSVSARSVELLEWRFRPSAEWRAVLDSTMESRRSLKYSLNGSVRFSEPKREFDFEYSSALAPVPGLPGVLR